jgi:TfoX/Sxy family transcriptional regulator of competence genes
LRDRFDPVVTGWPDVHRRGVFGSPAFTVPGYLFALFAEDEIIVKVSESLRAELLERDGVYEWVPPGSGMRTFGRWIAVPVAGLSDDDLLDILEDAYICATNRI